MIAKMLSVVFWALPLTKLDPFHKPILIIIIRSAITFTNKYNLAGKFFNFREANCHALNNYLNAIEWTQQLSAHSNINNVVDKFYEILATGFLLHI